MKPPWRSNDLPVWKSRRTVTAAVLLGVFFFWTVLLLSSPNHNDDDAKYLRRSLQTQQNGNCTIGCCRQYETTFCPTENEWINAVPVPVQWILIVFLVFMSACFSGLTLGLMGLDKTGLEIVMEGDDPKSAEAAKRIYPVRKKGNLLLCTLLLGNVAVNALLSILLADKAGGALGFVISTFIIVIFGEILPQALCSRYALEIGSRMVPFVKIIILLLWPIAAPLAWCLDKALGDELATTYSSSEMRKLLQIHVAEGRFDQETAEAMTGALKFKEIPVKEAMTPIDKTFMLNVDERLNFETIALIFKTGYSRIPVYEVSPNNIIGILFTKDLIFIDPEDETPIRNFISIFGRGAHLVWPDDRLGDVLRELKQGRSHMALVRDVNKGDESQDPYYVIKGIITLEDIIEEILGDEIVDETDAFVDQTHSVRVDRMGDSFDWGRLRLLDAKIVDETLSLEETKAVTAHLRTNYPEAVSLLSDKQLYKLVSETSVSELPEAVQEVGSQVPSKDFLMYEKGVETDVCTFILSGKVTVIAGAERFRSDVSSWTVLASSALTQPSYVPDFSAFVSGGPCRCLQFTRESYTAAVDASAVERRNAPEVDFDVESIKRQTSGSAQSLALSSDHSTSQHPPSPARLRETQLRRNKLIAAFQKANKKIKDDGDKKKKSSEEDQATEGDATTSEEKEREKSVRFLTSSEREASPLSEDFVQSQRSTTSQKSRPGSTTSSARDEKSSAQDSKFQYIDSSRTLGDDE